MPIGDTVNLSISMDAPLVTQAGFGTTLVFGYSVDYATGGGTDKIRFYSTAAEFLADTNDDDAAVITASDYEYKAVSAIFSQNPAPTRVAVGAGGAFEGTHGAELTAIQDQSNDWYGIVAAKRSEANILAVAAWAEANRKLYIAQTSDATAYGGASDGPAYELKNLSYLRTALMYYPDDTVAADAAWAGRNLAYNPDVQVTTWAHKTLTGVGIDTSLTTTYQTNIEAFNANYYSSLGGVGATWNGQVAKGEWIDVVVTIDWTYFRLVEDLQQMFLNYSNRGQRIPYTDVGIQLIGSVTQNRLNKGVSVGHFAADPEPYTTMPARSDVLSADLAARKLSYTFAAELSGAIQIATISGEVVVSLG